MRRYRKSVGAFTGHWHGELWSQALADLGRSRKSNGCERCKETIAASSPRLNQIGNPFGEYFALAVLVAAEKLANRKTKQHLTTSSGNVMNGSLILRL